MNSFNRKKIHLALCIVTIALMPISGWGQTFADSVNRFDTRLQEALQELSQVRESIASERVPIYKQVNDLEEEVMNLRQQLKAAERDRDNKLVDLNALKTEVKTRNTEKDYLTSLLNEYIQQFETRIHITEYETLKPRIDQIKSSSGKPDAALGEQLEALSSVVDLSLERLDQVIGGRIFPSQALSDRGILMDGKTALVGPIALFASNDGSETGLAELRLGSPKPKIISMGEAANASVKPFVDNGSGEFPLDSTMGNALKLAATKETWIEHLVKGGVVIIPMLVLAVISLVIALVKYIQFARIRRATAKDLKIILDHIDDHEDDSAKAYARKIGGPFGTMLVKGIENARNKKELIEEVVYEVMLDTRPKLERALAFISLTAATSPLLGLLGTVTGMIKTFKMITVFGTGDPKTLSGGISEALITTEYGLIIAVPTLILYALLARTSKSILSEMELISVGFVNGVPGEESDTGIDEHAAA